MLSDLNIVVMESDNPAEANDIKQKLESLNAGNTCQSVKSSILTEHIEKIKPDLVIIDPALSADNTLRAIQKIKIIDPSTPVLTSAHECLPDGEHYAAFEGVHYLEKRCSPNSLSKSIEDALIFKIQFNIAPDYPFIIGQSKGITSVRKKIRKIAEKDITVLVTGETGTGKELVARSIHYHSPRKKGPLVKVDCTSLPDELLESEVFGFQKGAFTDAYRDKPGRLEMANNGTLFIDEIGDISLSLQIKFMQVFEEKEFSRLGGTTDKVIDARVVVATNADLWTKVREGSFRSDLFYRLNIMNINVPPLRDRTEDIPLLIHYFQNKYCFEYKKEVTEIPVNVYDYLISYQWPGNIRELENVIRRAIAVSDWNFIFDELKLNPAGVDPVFENEIRDVNDILGLNEAEFSGLYEENDYSLKKITKSYVIEAEKKAILRALEDTQWNRTKAAKLLGVSYKTLINRIAELGLKP